MAKLISDVQSFGTAKFITESADTKAKKPNMYYLTGCFAVAD